ncbi:neuromedin U [Bizionia argentinensis JUB59]|uniref:Neuromedin U n=1 Tax=Bizionia argentinensis JUB59 TaxID=1046627 RepID=G2EDI1_9FLAO|nr:hypothetical protein [Bizionia argentinensis]EGV43500.1 neuromedin U [Bizionia argentinensis JUB59]
MRKLVFFAFFITYCTILTAQIQDNYSPFDDGKLLRDKIQNPIANMLSVPVSYHLYLGDRNTNIIYFEPIIPITIFKKWQVITKTVIPLMNIPTRSGYKNGLGNVKFISTITSAKKKGFSWGFGPAIMFPAVKEILGNNKLSIGPSIIALKQTNGLTYGLAVQNYFSIVGSHTKPDVNILEAQIMVSQNFLDHWYVYTNPHITVNWNAISNKQWSVPLGVGIGKLIPNRYLPINLKAGVYKFVSHPTNADWLVQAQATFIINSK